MLTFVEQVQALPPELFDEIYDLTFTPPTSTEVFVTEGYRPPALLRVSQATRERFAKSYYGNTTIFYVDRASAPKWIKSLADANVQIKSEIRLELRTRNDRNAWTFLMRFNNECRRAVGFDCGREFERTMAKLLRLQVVFGEPVRKVWMSPEDVPYVWSAYFAGMTATEWCERKFGKVEGAENASSEGAG